MPSPSRLSRTSISRKLVLIGVAAILPLLASTLYLLHKYSAKDIDFALQEQRGNQYLRPLDALLRHLQTHARLSLRLRSTNDEPARAELLSTEAKLNSAFADLGRVDERLGAALQFTDEGLSKRKRSHARASLVQKEWEDLRSKPQNLAADAITSQHDHLVADVRTMIAHAGDTSNLILDPDLDSYYLMDITLVALPQTQDRLGGILAYAREVLQRKTLAPSERTQFAVHAAMLKEADYDRITGDAQTALNEDSNFYGISGSFQKNLPPALKEYTAAAEELTALLGRLADPEKPLVSAAEFETAALKAREASFKLWVV